MMVTHINVAYIPRHPRKPPPKKKKKEKTDKTSALLTELRIVKTIRSLALCVGALAKETDKDWEFSLAPLTEKQKTNV